MIIVAGKALQQNEAVAAIPLKTMVPRRYRHRAKGDRHGCGTAEDRPECLDTAPCFAARQRRARCAIGINATGSKAGVKARTCHRSAIVAQQQRHLGADSHQFIGGICLPDEARRPASRKTLVEFGGGLRPRQLWLRRRNIEWQGRAHKCRIVNNCAVHWRGGRAARHIRFMAKHGSSKQRTSARGAVALDETGERQRQRPDRKPQPLKPRLAAGWQGNCQPGKAGRALCATGKQAGT